MHQRFLIFVVFNLAEELVEGLEGKTLFNDYRALKSQSGKKVI